LWLVLWGFKTLFAIKKFDFAAGHRLGSFFIQSKFKTAWKNSPTKCHD
jgi:hypothetical protein